jgi:hypothetical protein
VIVKELFAKLGLDVDTSGFQKADTLVGGLKAGFTVLGGIIAGTAAGLTAMVVHTADTGKEFFLLAQQTGMTTDGLQELAYAASRVGMSTEGTATGLIHLTRHMAAAKDGNEEAAKAFAKTGVKTVDATGHLRDAGDVLEDLAEHFSKMPDGADKTALSMHLFGKSGAEMIPLLNRGRDGIDALRASARDLGIVLDDGAIKQSLELKTALGDLKVNTTALQYAIAVPLMGTVTSYVKAFGEWIKANRALTAQRVDKVVTFLKVALTIALVPLKAVAAVLGIVIDNWKLIAVVLSSVVFAALVIHAAQVFAVIQGYIAAGAAGAVAGLRVAAAWVAANLPLILLTGLFVALILLIDEVVTAANGGKTVMAEWLGDWKDDQAGDGWMLRDMKALAYFMLHMDPVLSFWKGELGKLWAWMREGFINTWDDIVVGVKSLFGIKDDRNEKKLGKKIHYAQGYTKDMSETLGSGEWKENSSGEKLWYPFSDVDMAANAKALGMVKTGSGGTFSVQQTIHAAPGQSPAEVAGEGVKQMEQWHERKLAAANAEF